jgi:SAM-dependent methyltransferase
MRYSLRASALHLFRHLVTKEIPMYRRRFLAGLGGLAALGASPWVYAQERPAPTRGPDVIFVPTPNEVVDAMLKMAAVTKADTVYDLGCGDGRIVITAAQRYGARGVGIDIDPERVKEATENVRKAKVADRVRIIRGDLFEADISAASVVTLYLLTNLNLKLRPKLLNDLRPGTRVVSHAFDMGDWEPENRASVLGTSVYLWRIPTKKA